MTTSASPLSHKQPPRILVVDDDPTFVGFVCRALEKLGVRPAVSMSGYDALRRIETGMWTGVLLDLKLPDLDGLEVLRRMRQSERSEQVVVLTGAGDVPSAVAAMRLGAIDFVEKPIRGSTIQTIVDQLLTNGPDRPTDRPTDRQESIVAQLPSRTLRLAGIVARFTEAPKDARTVDAFCRASGLHLSSRAFRHRCESEGVAASAIHDLARVLRAARQAAAQRCHISDCLDGDGRSIRALFVRGFSIGGGPPLASPTPTDVLHAQCYVRAPRLIEAILLMLTSSPRMRTSTDD